jgi:hypothetical protein
MKPERLHLIAQKVAGLSHNIRTGGKIEFVKDSGPIRRDIRVHGFKWSPEALRNLAKILWATQRSHSYAMASLRLFSKMPSSEFSPDGLLGGRGYIQSIKDMRSSLSSATEVLSSFTDTVHDEINADHWANVTTPGTEEIVQNAEEVKKNPEQFVQQEFAEEDGNFENPVANNPEVSGEEESEEEESEESESGLEGQTQLSSDASERMKKFEKDRKTSSPKEEEPGSKLPLDGTDQKQGKTLEETIMHTTSPDHGNYAASIERILKRASARVATSSIPVETLPGPRVDHIGPAEGNEAGHFNDGEEWPSDDLLGEGLHSGVNDSDYLFEGSGANGDGVTGYDNPTDGDSSALKISSNYSWLPGASNAKNLNYYELGISADDIEWMKSHNDPDPPGEENKFEKSNTDWLWDKDIVH